MVSRCCTANAASRHSGEVRLVLAGFAACCTAVIAAHAGAQPANAPFLEASPFHDYFSERELHHPASDLLLDTQEGNEAAFLDHGYESLVIRIHLIRHARRSIDIQAFIWDFDESAQLVWYELIEAARRGVAVRVLIDHTGARFPAGFQAFLSTVSPNLEVRFYRPVNPIASGLNNPAPVVGFNAIVFHGRANQRMHNKLFIVDDAVVICGGRNYDNHYFGRSLSYNFKDREILVTGPILFDVALAFDEYWTDKRVVRGDELIDVANVMQRDDFKRYESRADYELNGMFPDINREADDYSLIRTRFLDALMPARRVIYLSDPPGKNGAFGLLRLWAGSRMTDTLKELVKQTERELVIQSPYVIVPRTARAVFRKLKKNSPDARVIISTNSFGAADHVIAYAANYRLRSTYIQGLDFHLYEYMPHPADLYAFLPNYGELVRRATSDDESGPTAQRDWPYLSLHGKAFVMDRRLAFVGTYNLDPRSFNLNTECGFLIDDEAVAHVLRASILRDTLPGNSWVVAAVETPLRKINRIFESFSRLLPIDLWPIRNTTSFELATGYLPVPRDHPEFYARYRDIGPFPGAESTANSQFLASFYKTFGKFTTPGL